MVPIGRIRAIPPELTLGTSESTLLLNSASVSYILVSAHSARLRLTLLTLLSGRSSGSSATSSSGTLPPLPLSGFEGSEAVRRSWSRYSSARPRSIES